MYLKCCRVFGRYAPERLLLKHEIVLKSVSSSRTRVNPEWVEELQQEKAIELEVQKSCLADRTAQK